MQFYFMCDFYQETYGSAVFLVTVRCFNYFYIL